MAALPSDTTAQQFAMGVSGPKKAVGDSAVGGGRMNPARIRDLFEKGSRSTRWAVYDYWINRAYLSGRQWVYWSKQQNRLIEIRRDDDRTRVVMNRMAGYHRTVMAKLHRNPLAFDVIPTAADDAAMHGARIAEAILADAYMAHRWEDIRVEADAAMFDGGTAALVVEWDPKAGVTIGRTDSGRPIGTGDVRITALSLPEMVTQPGARELETALWWIRNAALPPDEVKARYNLSKMPPVDAGASVGPAALRVRDDDGRNSANYLTHVLTYFERPYGDQRGQVVTVVGEEIVDQQDWPFPFTDRLNIVPMRETRIQGQWYGKTVLTDIVPMQAAYNASWSSIIEHMKLAGNARLFVNDASMDLIQEFTDTPGEIVPYVGNQIPEWGSPPAMPQWWVNQPSMLKNDMDDLMGTHNPNNPNNSVESGVGLTILAEADDTPLASAAMESARAWGRVAEQVLELYEANVKETRAAKLGSRPGWPPETIRWSGKDLVGQTKARVPVDAIIPKSRAADRSIATELARAGVITDIKTWMVMSGSTDVEAVEEQMDPDAAKAKRENHSITVGNVCVAADYDNHGVHINEHNRQRKSARYEEMQTQKLPKALKAAIDKEWKVLEAAFKSTVEEGRDAPDSYADLLDLHIVSHEVLAAEEQAKQELKAIHAPGLVGAAQATEPPGSVTGPQNQGASMPTAPAPVTSSAPPPGPMGPGQVPPSMPTPGAVSPAAGALATPGISPSQ